MTLDEESQPANTETSVHTRLDCHRTYLRLLPVLLDQKLAGAFSFSFFSNRKGWMTACGHTMEHKLHCVHASGIHSGTSSARPRFWNSDCPIGVSPPGLKGLTGSASPDLVSRLFKNTSENSSGDLEHYVREGFAFFSDTSVSNAEPHDSGYSTLFRF